jgi:hypothetical protein
LRTVHQDDWDLIITHSLVFLLYILWGLGIYNLMMATKRAETCSCCYLVHKHLANKHLVVFWLSPTSCFMFTHTMGMSHLNATNTISCLTRGQYCTNNEYEKRGMYILYCHTCGLAYIGHMAWDLSTWYKEHYWCIKTNNSPSAYALYILKNRHEYGTLPMIMKLIKKVKASMREQVHAYAKQKAKL